AYCIYTATMALYEKPVVSVSQGIRMMFYLMTPNETSFAQNDEVPEYVQQATPFFVGMILLELFVSWAKNGWLVIRINDGVTSVSAGMLSMIPKLFVRSLELCSYIYVWDSYRLLELPWDSPWTWWLAFLGVDFGYYWLHRFSHEVNIMWAAHQVHHSSEDYNLSTALRQSLTQQCTSWVFYLPMALAIPPSVFAVHIQFNLLYQFWIHTELVSNLGPVELIMNTPSHHRVHHDTGRNPYCIDKNYGGTLIIWDRLFGTFAPEGEKVLYGLTHPINSFELLWVQFHHYLYIWDSFWNTPGVTNKLSVVFKGPGWTPGKPRLGLHEDLPEITGKEIPHNPAWPAALQAYVFTHFIVLMGIYNEIVATKADLSQITFLMTTGFILLTLTSLGFLIDQRPNAAMLESVRCCVFLAFHRLGHVKTMVLALAVPTEVFFLLSVVYWGLKTLCILAGNEKKHQ
uniref:Alkylglycerol monooxygenase n=1 Tax=Lepisosteus oculatus TaxID=7918 RepID=W5MZN3_LEPOC